MSFKEWRTDLKLVGAQVKDGFSDGAWLVAAAVILAGLAVTFGLIVLAAAMR
ncbi:MAG TPA: hypothetical protein VN375_19235 [Vicinamibacteria bacterium]|jgi:hypothetical protein|nr:hypothetical protein [Vicinamibacteria bacterium]